MKIKWLKILAVNEKSIKFEVLNFKTNTLIATLTEDKIRQKLRKYALENKEPCYRYILAVEKTIRFRKKSNFALRYEQDIQHIL